MTREPRNRRPRAAGRPLDRGLAAVGLLLLGLPIGCAPAPEQTPDPASAAQQPAESPNRPLSVAELMAADVEEGFARADRPRSFSFPADHGPHPEFRTEWWYFTGHLAEEGGRRFGYQLTFFRTAMAPETGDRPSAWATRDTYMAHFTVTAVDRREFHSFERFARGAAGLAGADGDPLRVWLEDWSLGPSPTGDGFRVEAAQDGVALELELAPAKPPVLQGDRGLSRKGSQPGNASYYYSMTRLASSGTVEIPDQRFEVEGTSWLDREWSTSALEKGQVGWDWFSLQLSDGRDLMYYRLRLQDGTSDPASAGSLVAADGTWRRLSVDDVRLQELARWTTDDGVTYPSSWRLELPDERLTLEIRPLLEEQELRHTFRYWEGAVEVRGAGPEGPVEGAGYVELTGYADQLESGGR